MESPIDAFHRTMSASFTSSGDFWHAARVASMNLVRPESGPATKSVVATARKSLAATLFAAEHPAAAIKRLCLVSLRFDW